MRAGENYASANFDNYNKAFDESGVKLDLSVQNLSAGGFSPLVMVVPQGESPSTPRARTSRKSSLKPGRPVKTITEEDEESDPIFRDDLDLAVAEGGQGSMPGTPLRKCLNFLTPPF